MTRRRKRTTYFVCSSIIDSKLITCKVEASSPAEASTLYLASNLKIPENINGPFYLKKNKLPKLNKKDLNFSGITKKAIYKNVITTAFILNEPKNHAYLVFKKTIQGEACPRMKTTIIVPIEELIFV